MGNSSSVHSCNFCFVNNFEDEIEKETNDMAYQDYTPRGTESPMSSVQEMPDKTPTTPANLNENVLINVSLPEADYMMTPTSSTGDATSTTTATLPDPSETLKKKMRAPKAMSFPKIDDQHWEDIKNKVMEDPRGVYLSFVEGASEGKLVCEWSKNYVLDALAFARPSNLNSIPLYKFNSKTKEVLSTGIVTSDKRLCTGWLEFIKIARRHSCSLFLLEQSEKVIEKGILPRSVIGFHNQANSIVTLALPGDEEITDLLIYDAVAVASGHRGPSTLKCLTGPDSRMSASAFVINMKNYGDAIVFIEDLIH